MYKKCIANKMFEWATKHHDNSEKTASEYDSILTKIHYAANSGLYEITIDFSGYTNGVFRYLIMRIMEDGFNCDFYTLPPRDIKIQWNFFKRG